ncbi:putative germin-like protein subfamily 1 member 2 isoform X1 [Brassica napus]|nr:putative germin-like protein subfamily 1 member 2 isoform X1 [Brassica napus]
MKGLLQFLIAKIILLALASSVVTCYDPSPLQDYCVATSNTNGVFVNERLCKDPKLVTSNDFYFSGLNTPGNTNNRLGSSVTNVDVRRIPGLNTLGVALSRFDFAPGGQIPPHIHPRASQMILVLEGTLLVGFVSSNDYNSTLFSKVLYPGDVFAFPVGLVQFHANIGKTNAVAIGAVGSQNPGVVPIGKTLFGSRPLIDTRLLAKAFALDVNTVRYLQRVFSLEENIVTPIVN